MATILNMANRASLDHALHNEAVCKHLNKTPKHLDWVITTAFYSALHFVTHKLFPFDLEVNGQTMKIKNLNDYCNAKGDTRRKHNKIAELVEEREEDIADSYCQLRDASWTARYNQYTYGREVANLAVRRLKEIKEYCTASASTASSAVSEKVKMEGREKSERIKTAKTTQESKQKEAEKKA